MTCTALSDVSDKACRPRHVLDQYLHKALAHYGSILLVATSSGAIGPTRNGINRYLDDKAKEIQVGEVFVNAALEAIKNGNKLLHDQTITTAVEKELRQNNYDVIVLCQPSMSHLKEELADCTKIEVLTGIDYFIQNFELQ